MEKIIPFRQGASFYMKRGAKRAERNDLIAALARYRRAAASAPDDPEPRMAMAEILSQMLRFEESNLMLMLLMSDGMGTPECRFGLACNFFGMREYDTAADNLETYLDEEPDGPFAYDAEDFLDLIDDDRAMYEMTGLDTDQDYDDEACVLFVRRLLEGGEYGDAVAELKRQIAVSPESEPVKNQLALATLLDGDHARAKALSEELIAANPSNVSARCTLALLLHADGDAAGAAAQLDALANVQTDTPEGLHSIAALQLEMMRYAEAEETIRRLRQLLPYDSTVLHNAGYCRYMQGDAEGARACYQRIMQIDPSDTVARYYLAQCGVKSASEKAARARWMIPYQVSMAETFRRIRSISDLFARPEKELERLWNEDAPTQELFDWALRLPERRLKQTILTYAYSVEGKRTEHVLREFLLRTDQPDDLKRGVMGMLKKLGAAEPYMAYLNGQWLTASRVSMLEFSEELPAAYESIVQILLQCMVGARDEESVIASARIYHRYVESLNGKFPRISSMQEISLAAALEYLGCLASSEPIDEGEICKKYRVTETRLHNAMQRLEPFAAHSAEEDE